MIMKLMKKHKGKTIQIKISIKLNANNQIGDHLSIESIKISSQIKANPRKKLKKFSIVKIQILDLNKDMKESHKCRWEKTKLEENMRENNHAGQHSIRVHSWIKKSRRKKIMSDGTKNWLLCVEVRKIKWMASPKQNRIWYARGHNKKKVIQSRLHKNMNYNTQIKPNHLMIFIHLKIHAKLKICKIRR